MTSREQLIRIISMELKRSALIDSHILVKQDGYFQMEGEFNLGAVADAIIEWALKEVKG